ncbi:hypothetical protein [Pengzhenrongella sp.]|jgi:hypothetical protein|uniref:hypothetical protein n=1 Tax=Pengzhenrongella sp. TaxID=2888820 RepID=UPI002F9386FA
MPAVPPPVTFSLPAGWRPASVEAVQAAGLGFIALHPSPDTGFTANITLGGQTVTEPDAVTALADAAVLRLHATEQDVTIRHRGVVGHAPAPGLAQEVRLTTMVNAAPLELAQLQVFLPAVDVADESRQVVYTVTFTATVRQAGELVEDFQAFVRSVRPGPATFPEPDDG